MSSIITQLFVHPVKGLTPQAETQVTLQAGHGILGDRAFALMYDTSASSNSNVVPWMQKRNFAMQCDLPRLAALDCYYDFKTELLTIKHKGKELLIAKTNSEERNLISVFFTNYLATELKSPLRLVGENDGKTRYPDRHTAHISLINQTTLDQLSNIARQPVDIQRFRPNIVFKGIPAWAEFDWIGQVFQLGSVQIEITAPINRCLNIDVNPKTGEQDLPLLSLLQQHFHHRQTGVLAKVITSGIVAVGDRLQPLNLN
ncbi:MOSC domain-containing protein [Gloeocapsopsis crepidinum LEGE 06123]|uniref:MOSC domain-containing protein n=1 Tax=Gloeocapsopsis crepidinum LEGE 06123 TaxID=588587 RepID=A0ABR9USF2_9CHRO|nr:MOSC domain-containing protein [Gloeocapsopsis crepidinum]MBE9191201.1 MOSC domain-containing protein [Gloeocapsopsis crepidinum LEGE 06123]